MLFVWAVSFLFLSWLQRQWKVTIRSFQCWNVNRWHYVTEERLFGRVEWIRVSIHLYVRHTYTVSATFWSACHMMLFTFKRICGLHLINILWSARWIWIVRHNIWLFVLAASILNFGKSIQNLPEQPSSVYIFCAFKNLCFKLSFRREAYLTRNTYCIDESSNILMKKTNANLCQAWTKIRNQWASIIVGISKCQVDV